MSGKAAPKAAKPPCGNNHEEDKHPEHAGCENLESVPRGVPLTTDLPDSAPGEMSSDDDKFPARSAPVLASQASKKKKKKKEKNPQQVLTEFWADFQAKRPGKVTSVFPRRMYKQLLSTDDVLGRGSHDDKKTTSSSSSSSSSEAAVTPASVSSMSWSTISVMADTNAAASTRNAAESYEAAAAACRATVARIVRECHRANAKFTDPDYNLEDDPMRNCLRGLVRQQGFDSGLEPEHNPKSVHRVDWIFREPTFTVDGGFPQSEVRQGSVGDCWFIAGVASLAHRADLMERICVARDEACGVYGFVFQRDGAWFAVVVDDNLYLKRENFDLEVHDATLKRATEHRERYQTGSEALSFARCEDENETWLPLLEKAYAKAHGDYGAMTGGSFGEGIEDLTGGVNTTVVSSRVLDKDHLWGELVNTGGKFVYGLSILNTDYYQYDADSRNGLALNHCYSVLQAVEEAGEDGKKVRLVKIRNPWGHRDKYTGLGDWHGPWSDGSKEWTPYWIKKLGYTFGDNGVFWMTYKDMLETFVWLHRTRTFDAQWTVVQQWASVNVSFVAGYLQTKFVVDIKKPGTMVFVLSQLDERYFRGLRGQYKYHLHFVLRKATGNDNDRNDFALEENDKDTDDKNRNIVSIVQSPNSYEARAISCEVDIDTAGTYEVLPQVTPHRVKSKMTVDEVVRAMADKNPDKLRQVGQRYDFAHMKGDGVSDEDLALELHRAKRLDRARAKKRWLKEKKLQERDKKWREQAKKWRKNKRLKEKKKAKMLKKKEGKEQGKDKDDKGKEAEKKEEGPEEKDDDQKHDAEKKKDDRDGKKKDESDSETDTDFSYEEPEPQPEPDFDSDSEEDEDDLLSDDSSDDNDSHGLKGCGNKCSKKDCGKKNRPVLRDEEWKVFPLLCCHQHEDYETPPWSAVCVLGLRVYSQDPKTTITLVKPDGKTKEFDLPVHEKQDTSGEQGTAKEES